MNSSGVAKWVRPSAWVGITGAGIALLSTVASPIFGGQAMEQLNIFVTETARYMAFATFFFLLFWVALDRFMTARRLSRFRWPKMGQILREALFSACTQFTFIAVDIWIAFLVPQSAANSYNDINEHGWLYYFGTIFAVFVLHDTYFYWMHRIVHHPMLFNRVHRVHHESTDPTPFSAFHFHPIEALAEGGVSFFMLILFVTVPWHVSVPVIWAYGQLTLNVIGHLGYEIYPSWWNRAPLLRWKTAGLHHYLHHQMVRGNYGLYFRWWDKLCGTEFTNYERRYDVIFKENATGRELRNEAGVERT